MMASYRYTALNQDGQRIDGHVDAATVDEARSQLDQDGNLIALLGPVLLERKQYICRYTSSLWYCCTKTAYQLGF